MTIPLGRLGLLVGWSQSQNSALPLVRNESFLFLCSLPFLRNNQARKLGLDCLRGVFGWGREWGWLVCALVNVCQHLYIYLSDFPRHHPSELRTKPRDLGMLCLVLECHTLLLGSFVGTCSLWICFKVHALEETRHYSQCWCLPKVCFAAFFGEQK